ncbi:pyrroline-5-carboxylate reductase [Spirochaeta lutea]|uniref:Pyrroline-5-carboxylate reductase n=1 Tax=Spirochaeta lutea TaxID=1480694 RepID=A0A098QZ51_9SPIO|nr:pyrroline-5-carboxylate reductase [Spirochaeta lutea]KGE73185.1 hypothetical protein DC28_05285 [Spirochaeta lutea]
MQQLGIIGFGNMGEALVKGVRASGGGKTLLVAEKNQSRLEHAITTYGAEDCTGDLSRLFTEAQVVILAIKPQDLEALAKNIKPVVGTTPVISILAGKTLQYIHDLTGAQEVARFMPSLAAQVQRSVVGVCYSEKSSEVFRELSYQIANSLGLGVEVPERLMPAIIGTSGSGIAFAFAYLHAMALGGTKVGIPYDSSLEIALDVMEGAIQTIRETKTQPVELITKVCSPEGTTIEGILALEQGGFTPTIVDAVERAALRSSQLEQ